MKKTTTYIRKSLFEKVFGYACRLVLQKKMLLTVILLTNVLIASFSQKPSVLLSSFDSCHVRPPQQTVAFALKAAGAGPMLRVAYVIPSNRTPQPNGVANLQHAIKAGQQFFKEQMDQNGFGPKTYVFETEADGVTPLINVVHVTETDEYLRGDIWGRTQTAAINAGISLWAQGEVWVVIPETHLMFPDGSGAGGVALGAGVGSGNGGGVSMIGSNALPLFDPAMITDDTPYDGKVLAELGPYPMKQDVTFAWFEGTTFSSVASSWLGALWHETGHAFGLGHDFRNDNNFHGNLMGNGLRGTRGTLFPQKYPQDYTRLEYAAALFLNVSHYFNSDKRVTGGPAVFLVVQPSGTPQEGLVHLSFRALDPDGLSFAYLVYGGDMAAEILLDGTAADATFAVPYYAQGNINQYTIFVLDKLGNKTGLGVQFNVPTGNNQAPIPFIRIDPPVPGLNQSITLNAAQSTDVDHDQSLLLASWDVNNDGQFDTEPSTNKTVQYHYENPGNYLIRLKLTDPAGAQTISTPVSIKIPGTVGQVCQGDVTLSSQAEVDAFTCTEVMGNLTISGTDITNLNSLAALTKVNGALTVSDNPNLTTLESLSALDTIRGRVTIANNSVLVDIAGFSSLRSIIGGQDLQISNNNNLSSISGFNNLTHSGPINISNNPKLVSITGFNLLLTTDNSIGNAPATVSIRDNEALTTLGGFDILKTIADVRIVNNKSLMSLDGFASLTGVVGFLEISDNAALKSINGFNKLTGIGTFSKFYPNGGLLITRNPSLESFDGLSSLKSVGGDHIQVTVAANAALKNIDGLSSLTYIAGAFHQSLTVSGNTALEDCDGLFPYFSALGHDEVIRLVNLGVITVSENGAGCTVEDILNSGPVGPTCTGNFVLSSQAQVDAFNCVEVTGNLTISGNSISNLNGLATLKKIGGSLTIGNNPNLLTLDGLSSLESVGNRLYIGYNPKLGSISGFNSLEYVDLNLGSSELIIEKNDALTHLQGFGALTTTPNFRIVNNPALLALDGFPSLTNVIGYFQISNNDSLKTINGFNKLTSILGYPRLYPNAGLLIENNASLETLAGLSSLKSMSAPLDGGHIPPIQGVVTVSVTGNPKLTQCCTLQPLLDALSSGGALPFLVQINISENGGGCTPQDILACNTHVCSSTNLAGDPDATSVKLHWNPYSGSETITEYRVKRNGIIVGSTSGKYGYFTDFKLIPDSTYSYTVEVVGLNGIICKSNEIQVTTTSQTTIRTHYKLLAIAFNPNGVLPQSELAHIKTFLNYRLDVLKNASHNSVNLDLYTNDVVILNSTPPVDANSNVDYVQLASTSYSELGGNSIIDLIERYDIDLVWAVGLPPGYNFAENALMGNNNLGNNTWPAIKVKCSRPFFINSNGPDARAFDAAAHHVEGTMTSATEGSPENWPRDKEFLVYKANRSDVSVYPTMLHLWGRFRLTDEWNGAYATEGHASSAYASKGNASCGSSHFVPGSIRSSATYPDYTYYDIEAWQRYVDCYADEWLTYPNFSGKSRKINGYDFSAFNNYQENGSTSSFAFGTASFHYWWFNHIPHNPGVSDGKLNNWWPYIYDFNRFDGSAIQYAVDGFPVVPSTYGTTNDEYGTEEVGLETSWMFWHTNTDFGQRADVSIVNKSENSDYVKNGQVAIKVDVDVESFSFNGRNDVIYPRYKNAHWNFSAVDSITFSVKFSDQQLITGTNPIVRLCTNGNNRIEFVPQKGGLNANLFKDIGFAGSNGWYTFRIPVSGNATWARNLIGYIDPNLSESDEELAKQKVIESILADVNYFEISIQSDGSRGQSLVYYIDNLKVHTKDTTQHPLSISSFSLINEKTGAVIREFKDSLTLDLATLSLKLLAIQAHPFPEKVGSVQFRFDNKTKHTENVFPYIFTLPHHLELGPHTVRADVYSEARGKGEQGLGLTATVIVTNSIAVVSYDLVTTSGTYIRRLNEGDTLYLDDLYANGQTIAANTTGQTGSVKFSLNDRFFRIDNTSPYTFTGNNKNYLPPWIPQAGTYSIAATPYSRSNGRGHAGQSLAIHLTVLIKSLPSVVSYDLVSTSGTILRHLNDGDILYLDDLKCKGQTIVANTTGHIGSVKFSLNNCFYHLENRFPYTLTGNSDTYFQPWIPKTGFYTLTATPYSKSNATGDAGKLLTIHFSVIDKNNNAARMIATVSEDDTLVDDGSPDITIYPVPVENELFVKMDDTVGKDAMLSVITLQGLSVYQGTYSQSLSISTVDLKSGVYVLQVVSSNGYQRRVKFIKK